MRRLQRKGLPHVRFLCFPTCSGDRTRHRDHPTRKKNDIAPVPRNFYRPIERITLEARSVNNPSKVCCGSARVIPIAAFVFSILLSGCGGGGDSNETTTATPPPVVSVGSISGKAVDAVTGVAVAGANVTSGASSTTSDGTGNFTLGNVSVGDRVVVRASARNYAPNFETTTVSAASAGRVQIALLPQGSITSVNGATGGTATIAGSVAQAVLPANSVVQGDGSAYAGAVAVQLAVINPAANINSMPGDLLVASGTGTAPIDSFGALSVVLTGASGQSLNLGAGKTSTIRIPVGTRTGAGALPASVPLFYFNETTGLWVQEGTASLSATRTYYEGTVTHFSVWNADQAFDTITYTGCLVDGAGTRIVGATVASEGIDYSGNSRATSGTNGIFTVPMKRNGTATILGVNGSTFTNTITAGPSGINIDNSASCLTFGAATSSLSVTLSWGASPNDVDSHLYLPNGSHVYYSDRGSLTTAPFTALDVDDRSGFGPEVITVRRLMVGNYRYALRNYSGTNPPGLTGSPVRVELNRNGTSQIFTPTPGEVLNSNWWSVFTFTVDANCGINVTPVGTWSPAETAGAPATTAVYCTPS